VIIVRHYLFLQGIEIVSLESNALVGREITLQCHSRTPFNLVFQCIIGGTTEWFWTPQGSQLEHKLQIIDYSLPICDLTRQRCRHLSSDDPLPGK